MSKKIKINNHFIPRFLIKKWKKLNAKLYDKETNQIREIKYSDYSKKYYYSLGEKNDILENRISKFEDKVSKIITKVDNSDEFVKLSGKEIEILKLFCVLSASRQENTSSVINEDESNIYKNNNYIFGTYLIEDQKSAVEITTSIMEDFERINSLSEYSKFENYTGIIKESNNSIFAMGQHLVILRSKNNHNIISDVCSIIECTMDSDYLYTYVPISPKTSLVLVKSKYYNDYSHYEYTLERFGNNYGDGEPDPFISAIFEQRENILFNSYAYTISNVHLKKEFLKVNEYYEATLKIVEISKEDIYKFNSIFFEDGNKIVFINKEDLNFAKNNKLDVRKITLSF